MVVFDLDQEVKEISKAEEMKGKLGKQYAEDKLMNSVLASDKKTMDKANLINEATDRNVGSFTPDMMFSNMVENFSIAKQLYGEKLVRLLTGYDPQYIEKNLKIPEFKKELRQNMEENVKALKEDGLIDEEGAVTAKGQELGAMTLVKELDQFITKDSMGEKESKILSHYGEKAGSRMFRKGDRYKDLNVRKTVRVAIKRQRKRIRAEDLATYEREGKGSISLIFALDASASMKGKKLATSKRAGIALAYKAIQEKDDVGLVVFGSEIKASIPPTRDFPTLLRAIADVKASKQTDFAEMVTKSIELFPPRTETKHLVILTDAMPTVGKEPERETLQAVSKAKSAGITISLIGIKLEPAGEELARQIVNIGEGRFSLVRDLDNLGNFVLQDYYALRD